MDPDYDDDEFDERPPPPEVPSSVGEKIVAKAMHVAESVADFTEDTGDRLGRMVDRMNKLAAEGRIGKMFRFKERRAKLSTEIRAGTITFLMASYILAVNPQILSTTGGTCDPATLCDPEVYSIQGRSCLFDSTNVAAADCLSALKLSLTTATAATSLIACFVVGYFANLPLALAPGMGINIYLAYQVVAQDLLTYQQAMTAVFLEGWIFIILSMTGVRGGIIRLMPPNIAFASSVGIGLLLAFSGLRNLGVIVFDGNTLVTLGGCTQSDRSYVFSGESTADLSVNTTLQEVINSLGASESSLAVYSCTGGEMRSPSMWLGLAGGVIMALLLSRRVRGSLFIGIAFVTVISWIPGHEASYLGPDSPIPGGETRQDVFERVVAAPTLSQTGLAWDWSAVGSGHFWLALFTFLYIDLLDCTGTLLSMATLLDDVMQKDAEEEGPMAVHTPFISESREFPGQQWAFLADGLGIVTGSMMGISPVTVYIESAAGIEDGGRTGVAAIVVSCFFFVALFFSPILSSIPPYATGPALVLVGTLLIAHVEHIQWDDPLESIPAFLTVIIMPFTLSVAYGVIAGIAAYIILHLPTWLAMGWGAGRRGFRKWRAKRDLGLGDDGSIVPNGGASGGPGGGGDGAAGGAVAHYKATRRTSAVHVHRKVFGIEPTRSMSNISDDGRSVGSIHALEGLQIVGEYVGAAGPGASPMRVPPAGIRRSSSHGAFIQSQGPGGGGEVLFPTGRPIMRSSFNASVASGSSGGGSGHHGSMFGGHQQQHWGSGSSYSPTRAGPLLGRSSMPRAMSMAAADSAYLGRASAGQQQRAGLGAAFSRSRTFSHATGVDSSSSALAGLGGGGIGGSAFQLFPGVDVEEEDISQGKGGRERDRDSGEKDGSSSGQHDGSSKGPSSFSLFGAPLLDLNLDSDGDGDDSVEKNKAAAAAEEAARPPSPSMEEEPSLAFGPAAAEALAQHHRRNSISSPFMTEEPSLNFAAAAARAVGDQREMTGAKAASADMQRTGSGPIMEQEASLAFGSDDLLHESVDLEEFKSGSGTASRVNSDALSGGVGSPRSLAVTRFDSDLSSRVVRRTGSHKGYVEAMAAQSAAAAAAAVPPRPLVSSPSRAGSSNSNGRSRSDFAAAAAAAAAAVPLEGGGNSAGTVASGDSIGSGAVRVEGFEPSRSLKRVESAAAVRLRSLFDVSEHDSAGASVPIPPPSSSISAAPRPGGGSFIVTAGGSAPAASPFLAAEDAANGGAGGGSQQQAENYWS